MQRLRILHRTNASRFFMTDVKPSLTRLEEELKKQHSGGWFDPPPENPKDK